MSRGLELNPAQTRGVEHRGSPLLVLAGAGTGKTRVITHRVAALIDEGVPAWRILAVTFTNKAAHEMRERIAGLLGMGLDELRRDGPWIGTFHSICARILRRHGEAVGLSRNFAIYDVDDQKRLMRKVLKAIDVDPRMFSASAALGKIDQAKNLGKSRAELEHFGWGEPVLTWTRRAWALYEDQLRAADAADFGDLLTLTVELLRRSRAESARARDQEARAREAEAPRRSVKLQTSRSAAAPTAVDPVVGLRRRFMHVVVDEYQDTNPVQAELIELLCSERTELCVVGDDDQAIYGWRGADVGQIIGFPDRHPGCEIIALEQNYRSTTLILDCANALIQGGVRRYPKQLRSDLGPGLPVELCGFADEREEARFVARTVQQAIDEGESPSEIAVFYRTHAQSRPLEEAMRVHGIRYRMLGGIRFYDRREIKDLVAYLRLIANPASDVDCLRIINVPARKIGAKTLERLANWAARNSATMFRALGPDSNYGKDAGLATRASRAVQGFFELIEGMRGPSMEKLDHHQLAALVLERTGYLASLELEPDGDTRLENLNEFVGALEEFVNEQPEASLAEYLEQIALATDGDEASRDEAIILMTIHSAKGLEFDRVLLTGMEDNVFPHIRAMEDGRELDEERRLAYVALTRARRHLSLSHVEARFLWGDSKRNDPSEFLRSLPEPALVRRGLAARKKKRSRGLAAQAAKKPRAPSWDDDIVLEPEYVDTTPVGRQAQLHFGATEAGRVGAAEPEPEVSFEPEIEYDADAGGGEELFRGMRVRHPKFGVGTVLSWSGSGRNTKLELRFGNSRKTILARFCEPI